jgi:hypothetical protein
MDDLFRIAHEYSSKQQIGGNDEGGNDEGGNDEGGNDEGRAARNLELIKVLRDMVGIKVPSDNKVDPKTQEEQEETQTTNNLSPRVKAKGIMNRSVEAALAAGSKFRSSGGEDVGDEAETQYQLSLGKRLKTKANGINRPKGISTADLEFTTNPVHDGD